MSATSPLLGTGLSTIADKIWSGGVFYQLKNDHIVEAKHLNGVWSNQSLSANPVPVPLTPLASVTYDSGKQIRVYYLDTSYTIQEWAYTDGKGWYHGEIGNLKVKAAHGSGLAAVAYGKVHLRVYYQEAGTNVIAELANDGSWKKGDLHLSGALAGTSIAAVAYNFQSQDQIRVYYQAADLSLKEEAHNNQGWFAGSFNPGKAEGRTPIGAIAFASVEIQVYWRNPLGYIVFSKNTGSWGSPTTITAAGRGYYRLAVLQWDNGKYIRLYYQDSTGTLVELYSDDDGKNWAHGKFSVKAE